MTDMMECRILRHDWHDTRWDFWIALLWGCVANVATSVLLQVVLGYRGFGVVVAAVVIGVAAILISAWAADKRGVVCKRCGTKKTW